MICAHIVCTCNEIDVGGAFALKREKGGGETFLCNHSPAASRRLMARFWQNTQPSEQCEKNTVPEP